jgi:hypothetical protein
MQKIHLVILLHGLYGTSEKLGILQTELARAYESAQVDESLAAPEDPSVGKGRMAMQVFVPKSHAWLRGADGIDVNGYRVVEEVSRGGGGGGGWDERVG